MVSGPLFFKADFACPAEYAHAPKSGQPDEGSGANRRPGPSILRSGKLPRAVATPSPRKSTRMASENFNPAITFDAVAVDEKEDYWETTADILKRVWRPPWKRAAFMYRPTPGFVRADGQPGNLLSDGERGVDYSPTYHPYYSALSGVAARSRALSLASVVRTEIAPRPPGSSEDLRPAVGRTGDGDWIYTGGWDDDLEDRPSARTLTSFKFNGFAQIDDTDPEYDPDDYIRIEAPDIKPWWAACSESAKSENLAEACPSSSSRRRKRMAKRAREQQRLSNMSPAAWDQRLSAPQAANNLAPPDSIQAIFKEMGFDPAEPLDLRNASPPKGAGGVAKGGEFGQPNEPTTKGKSGQPDELKVEATRLDDDVTKLAKNREAATRKAQPAKATGKASVELWLVDTGCGSDLIEKYEVRNLKSFVTRAAKPITFVTANGRTSANDVARLFVEEFGHEIRPYILDSTPAVVSVGLRCMKLGYSFIWPARGHPYFILPNGNLVYLEVLGDIPYLRPGAQGSRPRAPSGACVLPAVVCGSGRVALLATPWRLSSGNRTQRRGRQHPALTLSHHLLFRTIRTPPIWTTWPRPRPNFQNEFEETLKLKPTAYIIFSATSPLILIAKLVGVVVCERRLGTKAPSLTPPPIGVTTSRAIISPPSRTICWASPATATRSS